MYLKIYSRFGNGSLSLSEIYTVSAYRKIQHQNFSSFKVFVIADEIFSPNTLPSTLRLTCSTKT